MLRRLQQGKLEEVRNDLKAGAAKSEIRKKYAIGEWMITRILLDSPGLFQIHWEASRTSTRNLNRRRILSLLAKNPAASRGTIALELPGPYDFALSKDRDWFWTTVPRRRVMGHRRVPTPSDYEERDCHYMNHVLNAVDRLGSSTRPISHY
jgi:hypothetical protein